MNLRSPGERENVFLLCHLGAILVLCFNVIFGNLSALLVMAKTVILLFAGLWMRNGTGYIRRDGSHFTWDFMASRLGYWIAAFPSSSGKIHMHIYPCALNQTNKPSDYSLAQKIDTFGPY